MSRVAVLLLAATCLPVSLSAWADDSLAHQSLEQLAAQMQAGKTSAESLVRYDLDRIRLLDQNGPSLHAIISLNPDALAQAKALDEERRAHGVRGPLHGIPILIKDNIETQDRMPTTAGSLALAQNQATADAPVVAALRAAGAVILGKTNLSEWANYRSTQSISGWSAAGGLTRNPYVLDRTACGSSAGSAVAVAAGLSVAALGSATDGSITCPSSMNGLVGLKPTVGLISQQGIIPVSKSQDTAGPMARNVTDVAILLTQIVRRATTACALPTNDCSTRDYTAGLDKDWLRGKRIGVLRFKLGTNAEVEQLYAQALSRLRAAGALLLDVQMPDMDAIEHAEQTALLSEFKTSIDAYLAALPPAVKTRSLKQLIEFDRASAYELELFGQDIFLQADMDAGSGDAAYKQARDQARQLAGEEGIDRMIKEQRLDLLVAPTVTPAWRVDVVNGDPDPASSSTLAAVAGYPHLTVPMGQVQELPVGLSFIGPAWSESELLDAGFAYESRGDGFVAPKFIPTLETPGLSEFQPRPLKP
ncbi:MAG TPA: amidase [Steroidobacteraceae bacterium]|jgi:amidase|nr:amidase [Steroidobacteraceae bacterium]